MGKTWLFVYLMPLIGYCQGLAELAGGRAGGLAQSTVALTDVWSTCHNPGAMAMVEGMQGAVSYEKRYLLNDLNIGTMALIHPIRRGAIGGSFGLTGFQNYQKMRAGLAYSHSFGENFSAGLKMIYGYEQLPEPTADHQEILLSTGILIRFTDHVRFGLMIRNPLYQELGDDKAFPIRARIGLAYQVAKTLLITCEVLKDQTRSESVRTGLEYTAHKSIALRIGLATTPIRHTLGFGFTHSKYTCDLGIEYMHSLGTSALLSLQYSFL